MVADDKPRSADKRFSLRVFQQINFRSMFLDYPWNRQAVYSNPTANVKTIDLKMFVVHNIELLQLVFLGRVRRGHTCQTG